jgi:hypothetical protein
LGALTPTNWIVGTEDSLESTPPSSSAPPATEAADASLMAVGRDLSRRTPSHGPPGALAFRTGVAVSRLESEPWCALVASPTTTSTRLATINAVSQSEWILCDDARRLWGRADILGIMH